MTTQTTETRNGIDLDQAVVAEHPRILLVDDEPDNVFLLKQIFQLNGFDVSGAFSGKDALGKIHEILPSMVILDIMMPDMDGWQTYQQLRKISDVPVVVISAACQTDYVVRALKMGAEDYITKPFNQAEVIARVNNIMRRRGKSQNVNRIGFSLIELILDQDSQEIIYKGEHIQLTGRMFEVLLILAKNAPRVVPYEEITSAIWKESSPSAHNRLKYLVYLLRHEFLKIDANNPVIKNIDRVGYKLITE